MVWFTWFVVFTFFPFFGLALCWAGCFFPVPLGPHLLYMGSRACGLCSLRLGSFAPAGATKGRCPLESRGLREGRRSFYLALS